jgi:hypothetical protein
MEQEKMDTKLIEEMRTPIGAHFTDSWSQQPLLYVPRIALLAKKQKLLIS